MLLQKHVTLSSRIDSDYTYAYHLLDTFGMDNFSKVIPNIKTMGTIISMHRVIILLKTRPPIHLHEFGSSSFVLIN